MEVRREVYTDKEGYQVTTYTLVGENPEIIITVITDGGDIIFVDNQLTMSATVSVS